VNQDVKDSQNWLFKNKKHYMDVVLF
jgi:hypothetical protein